MSKNIILGYGLLGKELVKQTSWDYLSRTSNNTFDFRNVDSYKNVIKPYETIINCVGYTDTYSDNRKKHWDINCKAVANLVEVCNINSQKLVHISTDYVYAGSYKNATENDVPVQSKTWYGYSKLLGDAHVQLKSNDYLIIRCGHKPNPFMYKKYFQDVIGNFDYVDKIAKLIIKLINDNVVGIKNLETEIISMYDLALKTKPTVEKAKCNNNLMPKNVSMRVK